jgi:ParB/RepB/Spo0J family partition protein
MNLPENLSVVRVKASSRTGGNPDRRANNLLAGEHLKAYTGQPSSLFEGGIPPQGTELRLHLAPQTSNTGNYSLYVKRDNEERRLANGRFFELRIEGTCLAIKGNCAPDDLPWAELNQITFFCPDPTAASRSSVPVTKKEAQPKKPEPDPQKPTVPIPKEPEPGPVVTAASSATVKIGYRFIGVAEVPVAHVYPFIDQPRKFFHGGKLRQLADSIQAIGLQQLIQVRYLKPTELEYSRGYRYMLVDGERRLRAHTLIEKQEIGATIVEVADMKDHYLRSLVLNLHREEHSHYELALAVIGMTEARGGNAAAVARDLSKSPAWVAGYLKLKSLDPRLFKLLDPAVGEAKQLRLSHATLLAGIAPDQQMRVYQEMIEQAGKGVRHMTDYLKSEAVTHSSGLTTQGRAKKPVKPSKLALSVVRGLQHMEHTVGKLVGDMPTVSAALDSSKHITREGLLTTIDKIVTELNRLRSGVASTS